jgi:UDP-3-O-[3-hydroxymyristoyl] N-acetylglucosamine deacetylase
VTRLRTLVRAVQRGGIGLHTGAHAVVTLSPAPFGTGLTFRTAQGEVPATLAHARAEPGSTVLAAGRATVRTPEHLLAALAALGVTDAAIELVGGDEVPGLDGSAAEWVRAIDEAGRADGPVLAPWRPAREVRIEAHGGCGRLGPGAGTPVISVEVDFGGEGPRGALAVPLTEAAFRREVAWARTFALARDVARLRAAGRGAGATRENTLVWPPGPQDAPRSADEPVRHKLLDAWGDLALLGPAEVALRVVRGSHALHLALLRAARSPSPPPRGRGPG